MNHAGGRKPLWEKRVTDGKLLTQEEADNLTVNQYREAKKYKALWKNVDTKKEVKRPKNLSEVKSNITQKVKDEINEEYLKDNYDTIKTNIKEDIISNLRKELDCYNIDQLKLMEKAIKELIETKYYKLEREAQRESNKQKALANKMKDDCLEYKGKSVISTETKNIGTTINKSVNITQQGITVPIDIQIPHNVEVPIEAKIHSENIPIINEEEPIKVLKQESPSDINNLVNYDLASITDTNAQKEVLTATLPTKVEDTGTSINNHETEVLNNKSNISEEPELKHIEVSTDLQIEQVLECLRNKYKDLNEEIWIKIGKKLLEENIESLHSEIANLKSMEIQDLEAYVII